MTTLAIWLSEYSPPGDPTLALTYAIAGPLTLALYVFAFWPRKDKR